MTKWTRSFLGSLAVVALVAAGITVVIVDPAPQDVLGLPGATAEPQPTGPTGGPGGDGGFNGGQFQPPGMPSPPNGYNGGNYPPPGQSDYGVDINSPTAQAPAQEGGQSQQSYPQRQQPVHGTQPPDYDQPPRRVSQPQAQQSSPQASSGQAPTQTQQPSQARQDERQGQNHQDECQGVSGYTSAVNGQINYSSTSQFGQQISDAAKSWSDLGKLQIQPVATSDSASSSNDQSPLNTNDENSHTPKVQVEVLDVSDSGELWGGAFIHSSSGPDQIVLNLARLDTSNLAEIQSVIAHEFGHAAGLADSSPGQLMSGVGELPAGPQAGDVELFDRVSTTDLTQQCAKSKLEDFIETWCPGGDSGWLKGTCNAVGAVGDYIYGFSAETISMIWDTISAIPNTIAFLDNAIPAYAFESSVRQAINNYFENFGWDDARQLATGAWNDFIEHDLWTSGQYAEWAGRMTPKIALIFVGGASGAIKFIKELNRFRDGLKVVVDIAQQAAKIGQDVKAIPKGGGQLDSLAQMVSNLKLTQAQAAEATSIASEAAFGETGGIVKAPDGTMVVLPANAAQKVAMSVSPEGVVTVLRNVDISQFLQYPR